VSFVSHPTRPGSALSLAAAVVALSLAATGGIGGLLPGVVLVVLGYLALTAASTLRLDDGNRTLGSLLLAAGVGLSLGGVAVGTLRAETLPSGLVVAAGLIGVALVGAGLAPVPRVTILTPRRFVSAGTAALVVCVVLGGLFGQPEALSLLAATAAVVVAWDAGDQAISLGEHVGRRARTWPVELGHAGATAAYGAVVVAATFGVTRLHVTNVPLLGLLLLLVGAVALLVALSN
jgi:hypothetical protein